MAPEVNENTNMFASNPSGKEWQMIDGVGYVKIENDSHGKYFIKGGTEKVYLSDYYEQRQRHVKKDRVQQDITNFFSGQIQDFKDRENYYANKVKELQGEILFQRATIEKNQKIAETNLAKLNPLYRKYRTRDVRSFSDNTDKRNGTTWSGLMSKANHSVTISEGLISVKQMFTETYKRLMNHTAMCGKVVGKIAQNTLGKFFS